MERKGGKIHISSEIRLKEKCSLWWTSVICLEFPNVTVNSYTHEHYGLSSTPVLNFRLLEAWAVSLGYNQKHIQYISCIHCRTTLDLHIYTDLGRCLFTFFYYFCIFRHANPSRNIDTLQKVPKLAQIPASKLQLIRLKLILNLLSKILSWNITANERGDSLCPVLAISWGLPFTSINSIPAISPNE